MSATIQTTALGVKYVNSLSDATPADVPVYNPNGLYKEWAFDETYRGKASIGDGNVGRYVPKVNDRVFHAAIKKTFIVSAVDPGTLLSTLVRYTESPEDGAVDEDFILGVGNRFPQQGYFIYVDNSVEKPTLAVDGMAYWRRPNVTYFRVFAGFNPLPSAEVISAWYNQSNEYVDDKIPAYTILDGNGLAAVVPQVGWAKRQIKDEEVLTVVAYDAKGNVDSMATFIGRNSGMVRQSNTTTSAVQSIQLIGPNVDASAKTIRVPVNATLDSIVMMCQVVYRGGRKSDKPIDGAKIRVVTDAQYIPASPGVDQDLTLIYTFDATEAFDGSLSNTDRFFQETYTVKADATLKAYGMRLFSYPWWKNAAQGYGLRHFLQTLDRDAYYDVTDLVELKTGSAPFDPLLFGTKQTLTLALDISKVDPRYTEYRHAQTTKFTLLADGVTDGVTPWTVGFENGQVDYGDKIEARLAYVSSQVWTAGIDCGAASQEEWLTRLYYATRPIYNTQTESGPMAPTHFVFMVAGQRYRKPISDWNTPFTVKTGGAVGDLAVIHWVAEVNGVDLQLASSGLIIRQIIN